MTRQLHDELKQSISQALEAVKTNEGVSLTDMYINVKAEDYSLSVYDDNETLLLQSTIDNWNELKEEGVNTDEVIASTLHKLFEDASIVALFDELELIAPFSVILIDDEFQHITELITIDRDAFIIDADFFASYDKELDDFFEQLMADVK